MRSDRPAPFRFTAAAESDLLDIARYIAVDNSERAASFVVELRGRCMVIAERPTAYRVRGEYGEGIRVVPHGRYLIFYAMRNDAVVIERIIHGARHLEGLRPGGGEG